MPTGKRGAICRECRRTFPDRSHLSKRYLCDECGEAKVAEHQRSMTQKNGAVYDRWREGMRRAADA